MHKLILSIAIASLIGCAAQSIYAPDEDPQKAQAQYSQATENFRQGEMLRALEATGRAIQLNPNYAAAYELRGIINQQLGRMEKAGESFGIALKLKPNEPSVLNNYANYQCLRKNYGSAMELFERAASSPLNEKPAIAYTNAGLCALRGKETEDAKARFERAVHLDPSQPNALYQLGQLSINQGNTMSANTWLTQYLDHNPHTEKSLLLGARIEAALGNPMGLNDYTDKLQQGFPGSKEAKAAANLTTDNRISATGNMASRSNVFDQGWVKERNPNHFTLHISSSRSNQELQTLALTTNSSETAIYFGANASYTLIVGNYADFEKAQEALKALPGSLKNKKPWIRNFEGIQATLPSN